MKTFLRIFRYAPNLVPRLIQFVIFSVLGTIFDVANIALAVPLFGMILYQSKNSTDVEVPQELPDFSFSTDYAADVFNFYFSRVISEHGALSALLFTCILVI